MDRPKYYPFLPPVPKELLNRQSKTWKERHAKGVPVVMNTKEWRECLLKLPEGDLTEFCQLDISGVKYYRGAPSVTFMDKGIRATFCNFRYKPEWLEKHKKQTI